MRAVIVEGRVLLRDGRATGIDAMPEVEPLLDAELELERLNFAIRNPILAEETPAIGLGAVDPGKLDAAITVISEACGLQQEPEAGLVYTDTFLPEMPERQFPGL